MGSRRSLDKAKQTCDLFAAMMVPVLLIALCLAPSSFAQPMQQRAIGPGSQPTQQRAMGPGPHPIDQRPIVIKETSKSYVPTRCIIAPSRGRCDRSHHQYYFSIKSGACERFVYGGCGGNNNRFATFAECTKTCTCMTPKETGPCRGHVRRWFYSPPDGCCKPFVYGGCGGNHNNYATWTECSNHCGYPSADSSWWKWGSKWGSHFGNGTRVYTDKDFMRDWLIWGYLTGGEAEVEGLAMQIAQFNAMGGGRKTGWAFGKGGAGSASNQWGSHGAAGGMANWGPTYKGGRPGTFTPLGEVGSIANVLKQDASAGQFNQRGWNWNNNLWGQGSANQFQGSATASNANRGNWFDRNMLAQLGIENGGMLGQGFEGWGVSESEMLAPGIQRTFLGGGATGTGGMGGQFAQGQGKWNVGGSWNTGGMAGNANAVGGTFGIGLNGMELFNLIRQLGSGEVSPETMHSLAYRFAALKPDGKINFDLLARGLIGSLQGPAGANGLGHLKGLATTLGAIDNMGNIDIDMMFARMMQNAATNGGNAGVGGGAMGGGGGMGGGGMGGGGMISGGGAGMVGGGAGGMIGGGMVGGGGGGGGMGGGAMGGGRGISGGGGGGIQGGAVGGIKGAVSGFKNTGAGGAGGMGGMGGIGGGAGMAGGVRGGAAGGAGAMAGGALAGFRGVQTINVGGAGSSKVARSSYRRK